MSRTVRSIAGFGVIVGLWWAGGRIAAASPAPLPGAILGLALLLALLRAPGVRALVAGPAGLLAGVLGALIVPAAVALGDGIPGLGAADAARVGLVLVASTLATGVVTALAWRALAR